MGLPAHQQDGQPLSYLFHMKKEFLLCLATQSCLTFETRCEPQALRSLPGSSVHGDSPGKNTGVGCHALLQGIFPIQGSNLGLSHCRQILYHLATREARPPTPTPQKCLIASKKFKPCNSRAEVGVLWPMGHILSKANVCFYKESFIRTQPHPIGYVFSGAAPTLNGRVFATEKILPTKPKIRTVWPFVESLLTPALAFASQTSMCIEIPCNSSQNDLTAMGIHLAADAMRMPNTAHFLSEGPEALH